MAQKLEELLGPWERVLFRSASGRRRVTILSVIFSPLILLILAPFLASALSNPVNSPARISSLVLTLFAGYAAFLCVGFIVKIWRREILVTDHRVLYRHGTWRPRITEIPLAEITGVVVTGSGGTQMARIERGQKGAIIIWPLPHLDQLRNDIATLVTIPAPQQNEKAVRRAIILLGISACLGGAALGLFPTLGLYFIGGGGNFWESGATFWDLVFLYPTDSTFSAILVGVAGFIGFVGYMWLTAAFFGGGCMLGYFPAVVIFRYFLTPAQAQKTVCYGYQSMPANGFGKVHRWYIRQIARFASWLYGQEIRCD